jgi:hypothetical protein
MPATRSRFLIVSDHAYRLLLLAYPSGFRQRYEQEMAQVYRTCCRAAYASSGVSGVLLLWLPTLWDWAWSVVGEWVSSVLMRLNMKDSLAWLGNKLSTLILIFFICLPFLFCYMACGLLYAPYLLSIETCGFDIDNQSGKTLRLTAIDPYGGSSFLVQIIRTSWPYLPAFQQRNITVKSGDLRKFTYDCTHHGEFEIYACDLEGECYVNKNPESLYQRVQGDEDILLFNGFRFKSLESLPHPDQAIETIVKSIPEHDYSGLKYKLLGLGLVIALFFGSLRVVRARRSNSKHESVTGG